MENSSFKTQVEALKTHIAELSEVHFFESLSSTNDKAKQLGKKGASHGTLMVANQQLSGRGRRDRHWESPSDKGLYFSLILRPNLPPAEAPLLTLAAGLALQQVMASYQVPNIQLKWPNDILLDQRKVAGILTEMQSDAKKIEFVVLGIGLNVHQNLSDFPEELQHQATSLQLSKIQDWKRSQILKDCILQFFQEISQLEQQGAKRMIQKWEKKSAMLGKKIQTSFEEEKITGIVQGLNAKGHLQLEKPDGNIITLIAEEIRFI